MRNLLFFSSFVFVFLIPTIATSQIVDDSFNTHAELSKSIAMPKTSETFAFQQYGNTPVDLYYKKPNIKIPLYVHSGRELDLPISLSYDASGVKVEQATSNVGLSWNLNVGGRISRIVNGLPDDYIVNSQNGLGTSVAYYTIWNDDVNNWVQSYAAEHDIFLLPATETYYINASRTNPSGQSGQFTVYQMIYQIQMGLQKDLIKSFNQSEAPIRSWYR